MKKNFKISISKKLENNNIYLYWKGRVALYAILKSMGIGPGDEVILPAYTCIVVPNAIIYLGATPIYVDIQKDTYNSNPNKIRTLITKKTKAIILQNTYGLSSNIEEIVALAEANRLYTIEDCTHGFGGTYNNKPNGSYCDAAFYSTQWNKPFSTGIGGFSMINNMTLIDKLESINQSLEQPSFKEELSLKIQLIARSYLINNTTYWAALKLYRFLSSHNLILGSSSGDEISTTKMPEKFFKAMSTTQTKAGDKALKKLNQVIRQRKKSAEAYTQLLSEHSKHYVDRKLHTNHSFLKYPLLVNDRDHFFKLAEKNQIMLGDWFTSPLHPVEKNLDNWFFEPSKYPVATDIAAKMVNLPTDINETELNRVLKFISNNLSEIL